MARETEARTGMTVWRNWSARLSLQRAMLREQLSDLRGRRETAEKRAAAAERIAWEANAARLKVLLDAAREQAALRPIESAEKRFAVAKDDWKTAQLKVVPRVGGAAGNRPGRAALVERPVPAETGGRSTRVADAPAPPQAKRSFPQAVLWLAAGVIACVVALYLYTGSVRTVGDEAGAAGPFSPPATAMETAAAPGVGAATVTAAVTGEAQPPDSLAGAVAADTAEPAMTDKLPVAQPAVSDAAFLSETGEISERRETVAAAAPVSAPSPAKPKPLAKARARPAFAPTPRANPFRTALAPVPEPERLWPLSADAE